MTRTMFWRNPLPWKVKVRYSPSRLISMLSTFRTVDFFILGFTQKFRKSCSPCKSSAAWRIFARSGRSSSLTQYFLSNTDFTGPSWQVYR